MDTPQEGAKADTGIANLTLQGQKNTFATAHISRSVKHLYIIDVVISMEGKLGQKALL
jgi:hypothetical protein